MSRSSGFILLALALIVMGLSSVIFDLVATHSFGSSLQAQGIHPAVVPALIAIGGFASVIAGFALLMGRMKGALVAVFLYLPLQVVLSGERYCLFYPEINTRYAPAYSERTFAQIQLGMTDAEVRRLLGEPLGTHSFRGKTEWGYSSDVSSKWGDWAWMGRSITFSEGRVSAILSRVWYD